MQTHGLDVNSNYNYMLTAITCSKAMGSLMKRRGLVGRINLPRSEF